MKSEPQFSFREADVNRILQAKKGDETARTALLEQYMPLIASLSYRYAAGRPAEDLQDLSQEAAIAFFHALDEFDAERGIAFGYFAKICISNCLIGYLRKRTANPAENALSFEETDLADAEDPMRDIREYESYIALCKKIRTLLSEKENRIWTLFVSGYTAAEIARKTGTEKKSVENALARARRKLKKQLPRS